MEPTKPMNETEVLSTLLYRQFITAAYNITTPMIGTLAAQGLIELVNPATGASTNIAVHHKSVANWGVRVTEAGRDALNAWYEQRCTATITDENVRAREIAYEQGRITTRYERHRALFDR